jgi:hypothetical protein
MKGNLTQNRKTGENILTVGSLRHLADLLRTGLKKGRTLPCSTMLQSSRKTPQNAGQEQGLLRNALF